MRDWIHMQLNLEKTNGDWERAADAGHPGAQFHLGLMYATGEEIPLDLVLAHKWLNLAATRGSGDATTLRAEITSEMSRKDVMTAQRLARDWLDRFASDGTA